MKSFPNWKSLANAEQSNVLRHWKGLGYNSRALRLQKLAQYVSGELNGELPNGRTELESLPGIGPYTAGAVRVFAFEIPDVFIETNIRRIFIHHFPKILGIENVDDKEIMKLVQATLPEEERVFDWYAALMDYGSTLPKIIKQNPNKKSKHYTKQSKFIGSDRQVRGGILSVLLNFGKVETEILRDEVSREIKEPIEMNRFEMIVAALEKEGFILVDPSSAEVLLK
jgi:A/G-specific adenine glycosylase